MQIRQYCYYCYIKFGRDPDASVLYKNSSLTRDSDHLVVMYEVLVK